MSIGCVDCSAHCVLGACKCSIQSLCVCHPQSTHTSPSLDVHSVGMCACTPGTQHTGTSAAAVAKAVAHPSSTACKPHGRKTYRSSQSHPSWVGRCNPRSLWARLSCSRPASTHGSYRMDRVLARQPCRLQGINVDHPGEQPAPFTLLPVQAPRVLLFAISSGSVVGSPRASGSLAAIRTSSRLKPTARHVLLPSIILRP